MQLLKLISVSILSLGIFLGAYRVSGSDEFEVWQGGTGFGSARYGELIIGSSDNTITLSKIATGSEGQVLKMVSGLPTWAAAGGSSNFTGLDFGVIGGTQVKISSLSFDAGGFNLSNTASEGFVRLNYTNGPASRSMANTWTGVNTFTAGASISNSLEVAGTASISGATVIGRGLSGSAKGLVVNNSTSTGNIFEAQDNGSAVFTVADGGLVTLTGQLHLPISTAANPSIYFAGATNYGIYYGGGVSYNEVGITIGGVAQTILGDSVNGGITLGKDLTLKWSNNTSPAATRDTFLGREAAAILQMGLDVNGSAVNQTFKAHDGITGTDISGANLTIAGGRGTGAGLPGLLQFQTATQLGTGTTAQTLSRIGSASQAGWEFSGMASASTYFSGGLTSCTGSNFLQWSAGLFGCATPSGGGGTSALQIRDIPGSYTGTPASLSFDGGKFVLTASGSSDVKVSLNWTTGPASRAADNAWTATGSTSFAGSLDVAKGIRGAIITATSKFLSPFGTAGAPTHSFVGDDDTGMFRVGANILAFSTGGSERWRIQADGALTSAGGSAINGTDGTAAAPGYRFGTTLNTGIYQPSSIPAVLAFSADGVRTASTSLLGGWELIGRASVSGNLLVQGIASSSFAGSLSVAKGFTANSYQGGGLGACTGSNFLQYSAGQFSCATPSGGGGSSSLQVRDIPGSYTGFPASMSFDGGKFDLTASGSTDVKISLDWTNGPASRSTNNAWTATGSTSFAGSLSVAKGFTANSYQGGGLTGCTGTSFLQYVAGQFGCGTPAGGSFGGLDFGVIGGTPVKISSISFDAGMFDLSNTASEGFVRLDWVNGPASRSLANTWALLQTFSRGASMSESLEVATYASASYYRSSLGSAAAPAYGWRAATGLSGFHFDTASGGSINIDVNGAAYFQVTNGGYLQGTSAGGGALRLSGDVTQPVHTFNGDLDTGLYTPGANVLGFSANALRVGSASNSGWEFGGNASISGVVFQNALGSSSFNGTIVGPSAGVLSIGTVANYLRNVVANVGRFLTTLVIPSGTNPTLSEAGSIAVNTASGSFEYRTSTQTKVLGPCTRRPSYVLKGSDLTAKNQWSILLADDPYSLRWVSVTASGTNSLSWNLRTGSATVPATNVFTLDKKASGSAIVRYDSFAVASISDGFKLDIVVTSASATLDSVLISTCVDADTTE